MIITFSSRLSDGGTEYNLIDSFSVLVSRPHTLSYLIIKKALVGGKIK
jgi:hypothetical protein